jgi:methylmalonyl-CoA mutase N-terminal domain/subunit
LGGSFYVEAVTNRLEAQALAYFKQIEEFGGVLPAIQASFFQREIQDAAYRYQREIDSDERYIVGVNAYQDQEQYKIPMLNMDPEGLQRQTDRLQQLRTSRDAGAVGQALDRLRLACTGTENSMPLILDAVRNYATLGEIVDVMRDVFGTYQEPSWL